MRFSLSSSALSSRLLSLSRVINNKNSLPILSCFLFQVKDNVLTITASDSENVMKTTIELTEHDGDGEFAVQSQTILDAVKELPEQPLTLNVNLDEHVIYLTYQNGSYHFPVQSAEEYPREQEMGENASKFALDAQVLSSAISRSLFAAAQDELRPVMNGIYFDLKPDCLSIVATDGHKLVRNNILSLQSETPASFILPRKPATLLKGVLPQTEGEVTMSSTASRPPSALPRATWLAASSRAATPTTTASSRRPIPTWSPSTARASSAQSAVCSRSPATPRSWSASTSRMAIWSCVPRTSISPPMPWRTWSAPIVVRPSPSVSRDRACWRWSTTWRVATSPSSWQTPHARVSSSPSISRRTRRC